MQDEILNGQVEETTQLQQASTESDKEKNIRILRERALQLQQKVEQMEQEKSRYQQNFYGQPQYQQTQKSSYEDEDEDEDGYVDKRKYRKMEGRLTEQEKRYKEVEDRLNQVQQYAVEQVADARLNTQFKDFNAVLTDDNINTLKLISPQDFDAIRAIPDIYTRKKMAYYAIKNGGILETNHDDHVERKIEENRFKPKSPSGAPNKMNPNDALANASSYDGRKVYTSEDRKRIMERFSQMKRGVRR